jgi:hypothetical protein
MALSRQDPAYSHLEEHAAAMSGNANPWRFDRCPVLRFPTPSVLAVNLPAASVVGTTRVGGVNIEQARMRTVMEALMVLSLSPTGHPHTHRPPL